jgi:hypothetical protein
MLVVLLLIISVLGQSYVSLSGNDSNNCAKEFPCETILNALKKSSNVFVENEYILNSILTIQSSSDIFGDIEILNDKMAIFNFDNTDISYFIFAAKCTLKDFQFILPVRNRSGDGWFTVSKGKVILNHCRIIWTNSIPQLESVVIFVFNNENSFGCNDLSISYFNLTKNVGYFFNYKGKKPFSEGEVVNLRFEGATISDSDSHLIFYVFVNNSAPFLKKCEFSNIQRFSNSDGGAILKTGTDIDIEYNITFDECIFKNVWTETVIMLSLIGTGHGGVFCLTKGNLTLNGCIFEVWLKK